MDLDQTDVWVGVLRIGAWLLNWNRNCIRLGIVVDFSLKIILQGDTSLHPCRGLVLWLTTEVVSDWHLIGLDWIGGLSWNCCWVYIVLSWDTSYRQYRGLVWHLIGQDWLRLDTNWNDLRIRVFWGLESWPWIHPPRRPGTIPYRALVPRLSRQMVLVNGMGLAWLLPMQGQSNSSCNLGCRSAWPERHAVWCISKGLVNCFQIGRLATHWHIGTGLDRIGQDWQIGELVLQWKIDL